MNNFTSALVIAIAVALACFALGWIDHETTRVAQLFEAQNLAALTLYFLPTYAICLVLRAHLFKRHVPPKREIYALLAGIPAGIGVMIALFHSLR